jgi:hypothetical protein
LVEERDLKAAFERLNGTWAIGPLSVITIHRLGGGWIFVSGQKAMFSNFVERAYLLDEHDAYRLIQMCPNVLKDAKILIRGRWTSGPHHS